MRLVDDLVVSARRSLRRAVYASPAWRSALPEFIIVELPVGDSYLNESQILRELGALVHWLGPVPVTITGSAIETPEVASIAVGLVRFARRSGAYVRFVVEDGLSQELCHQIVRAGVDEVVVMLGSLEEEEHAEIVGGDLRSALDTVGNLREARAGSGMKLVAAVVVSPKVKTSLRPLVGWARQSHVDDVIVVPSRGSEGGSNVDLSGVSVDRVASSLRGNSWVGSVSKLPLAIKLAADGSLYVGRDTKLDSNEGGDLGYLWRASVAHRAEVRRQMIPFDEIDFALWSI